MPLKLDRHRGSGRCSLAWMVVVAFTVRDHWGSSQGGYYDLGVCQVRPPAYLRLAIVYVEHSWKEGMVVGSSMAK